MTVARIRARLFPDYGDGSPIWLPGRRLDWDDVKVTAQLKSRLVRWADDYENGTTGMSEDEFVAGAKPLSPPFFVLYSIAIAGRRACLAGDFAAAEQRATDMRNAAAQAGWDNEAPTGMQVDQQWACWYL